MSNSLLLVGVGGQGTILVSKILSQGLVKAQYDVKMSEIHGMSQRGGSVTTQIKFGEEVYSPAINKGEADLLVAFEKLEAARYIDHLKKRGTLIVNDEEIYPLSVLTGSVQYPEGILDKMVDKVENVKIIEARRISEELGEPRCQNIVILGAIVKELGLEDIDWIELIKENLPERVHEVNIKAFERGLSQ
ncbi:indolepyruvate oxidoreductase subunit beta [Tepidimicrobium xylanilyticum]|uniref:Indolepyruvate ferredoxin oxidoreductase beta subunit n=1 Tax=Tepidimicrobium xylanilyticum TaxID=1123352 RepID=A0A1H3CC36_9FIRM|nr:indolepyruvate oxidoreductase subunit beta [Tepidimicrobium xylanilyticum]GMG98110.1 indolepyruvate oxidoreductase [Tepidimicrobium xylanilyticum]SDX51069.1 indolepyruvate ferredoxin oxidoreductase beta subunit [Tepidimicrobium xylanilyticum]